MLVFLLAGHKRRKDPPFAECPSLKSWVEVRGDVVRGAYMLSYMYKGVNKQTYARNYMYTCSDNAYARMYICAHVCMYVRIYACMHVCVYIYVFVFIFIFICIFRHTCISPPPTPSVSLSLSAEFPPSLGPHWHAAGGRTGLKGSAHTAPGLCQMGRQKT